MPNKPIRDAAEDFKARAIKREFERQRQQADEPDGGLKERLDDAKIRQLNNAAAGFFDPELSNLISKLEKELKSRSKPVKKIAYNCDLCKDTGVIDDRYCACYLNYIYVNCYGAVDTDALAESFDNFNIDLFDDKKEVYKGVTQRKLMETARDVMFNFAVNLPNAEQKKILISGKTGLGKTYLLRATAKAARLKNIDAMLIEAPKLFDLFHMHRLGNEVDLSYIEQAQALLIDDLGAEPKTNNVSDEYFYNLLETRLNNGLYTVIATNETRIPERYDERIASRLYSVKDGAVIELEGDDLRNKRV